MGLGNSFPCPECLGHRAKHLTLRELVQAVRRLDLPDRQVLEDLPAGLIGEDCWMCPQCFAFGISWMPDGRIVWDNSDGFIVA